MDYLFIGRKVNVEECDELPYRGEGSHRAVYRFQVCARTKHLAVIRASS